MACVVDKERLRGLRDAIGSGLVEREVATRLVLLAAVAGEHLLLLGPPGTAKSMLARRLRRALRDDTYFEHLLTRFTVPEEIFGPLSLKALEQDQYRRQTAGYLPTASVAFLDEIFKSNSAILNALLTLLNEREFDNGAGRIRTPLVTVVGASNELPESEELDALYDRFLLRLHVKPVSDSGFEELLKLTGGGDIQIDEARRFTNAELEAIRDAAPHVKVPDSVWQLLRRARTWASEQQIVVSDRRWRKIVHLLRVAALTDGRDEVSVWDCWLLQHCLWQKPEQRAAIKDWYANLVGSAEIADPEQLIRVVLAWESRLAQDAASQSQARNEKGELLFAGLNGSTTAAVHVQPAQPSARPPIVGGRWDEQVWEKPSRGSVAESNLPPVLEPTRYSSAHIRETLSQIEPHLHTLTTYEQSLQQHLGQLEQTIGQHLWVDPRLAKPATRSMKKLAGHAAELIRRLNAVAQGYEALPRLASAVPTAPPKPASPKAAEPTAGEQLAATAVGALLEAGLKQLGKKF